MGSRISELPLCQRVSRELDLCYSVMGSLFWCGFRQTLFSSQLMRYADLYTATCLSFLYHPLSSLYRAAWELMPHETAVERERAGLVPAFSFFSCSQRETRHREDGNYPSSPGICAGSQRSHRKVICDL
ncbi:hypothetical protein AB1E18_008728 [Capra hircus]